MLRQPQLAACCRCSANNNKEKTTTTAAKAATDTKEKTKPTKTTVCDIVTRRFVPVLQCLQAFGPIIHEFTGRTSHALHRQFSTSRNCLRDNEYVGCIFITFYILSQ